MNKLEAEARREQIKTAALEKKICMRDDVKAEFEEALTHLRDGLRRLPGEIAVEVPAELKPAVMAAAKRKVEERLTELAAKGARIGG